MTTVKETVQEYVICGADSQVRYRFCNNVKIKILKL
jgi:hypothetical protein